MLVNYHTLQPPNKTLGNGQPKKGQFVGSEQILPDQIRHDRDTDILMWISIILLHI